MALEKDVWTTHLVDTWKKIFHSKLNSDSTSEDIDEAAKLANKAVQHFIDAFKGSGGKNVSSAVIKANAAVDKTAKAEIKDEKASK